ncbi:hypothetical protein D3C83_101050 [compost metagenome]
MKIPKGIISHPPSVRNRVADASWMDMMKENSAPTRMPFQTSGAVMSRKVPSFVAPTFSAASSIDLCTSRSED